MLSVVMREGVSAGLSASSVAETGDLVVTSFSPSVVFRLFLDGLSSSESVRFLFNRPESGPTLPVASSPRLSLRLGKGARILTIVGGDGDADLSI